MIDGAYALAGALTGFVVGLTGVGGGALMMPILLLLGVAPTTAIATDLWFAALTKAVAACIHNGSAQVDWVVVKRLWYGSLPTIGVVILITALGMLLAPALKLLARERRLDNPSQFKRLQPGLTVLAGLALGLCVALTSVGAGALGSVILLYLYPLRMTPHRLVATDIMHAIPLALVAGLGYLFAGMVDGQMLISLLAGSIPTVVVGSLLSRRLNGRWIQVLLAMVLLAAGLKTLS
jgi:uncharacterized membrane protein YfcA